MNHNNPIPQSTSRVISIFCGVLFFVFCFSYIFCMEGDLLAQAQYVFAKGVTSYNDFIGALIIAAVLKCVQSGVGKLTKLSGCWYALSYFPSFLILAVITSVNQDTIDDFTFSGWYWAVPLLLGLFVLLVVLIHRFQPSSIIDGDYSIFRYLWPNFLTLMVMILLCCACHTADDSYQYELHAERLILKGKFNDAALVGRKSYVKNKRLNCLRYYALVRQGKLADHLFDYPTDEDSELLIDLTDTNSLQHQFTTRDICAYLGAIPNKFVTSPTQYFEYMLKVDSLPDVKAVTDYYLCSLLMDRDLNTFYRKLPHYYSCQSDESKKSLPRIFKEALIISKRYNGRENLFPDERTRKEYEDYRQISMMQADLTKRANLLRRKYGNTLWWYLDQRN